MIKLIIFDLDGVLIESTKELHFKALNRALYEISPEFIITTEEHNNKFNALSTKQKLKILTIDKGLKEELHKKIEIRKQEITFELLENENFDVNHSKLFKYLKNKNIKIAVCTNSIKKTTLFILKKLNILNKIDLILTNEDVTCSKPNSEIFETAINHFNILPEETLIFEDSVHGIEAASNSGAFVKVVKDSSEIYVNKIQWLFRCIKFTDMFNKSGVTKVIYSETPYLKLKVTCPICKTDRLCFVMNIKLDTFTSKCKICSARKQYNDKLKDRQGYRLIPLFTLSEEDKNLCFPMINKGNYIREHRLVMAKHLNRSLLKNEIVHHKNGVKDDNNIDNLELLSVKTHHKGHGDIYYQKWQEALTEIDKLKKLIK